MRWAPIKMRDGQPSTPQAIEVDLEATIPQRDLFDRAHPAMGKGPQSAWNLGRTVIDFACALIGARSTLRNDRRIRDAVLGALLRRATITVEGCYDLLAQGLLEPAFSVRRTLLDLDLSLNLIHLDATDRMAKRLAAYHYYAYQRHGQDMLANRETREGTLTDGGRVPEIIEVARGYARMLGTNVFDDVREEVSESRYWHNYDNPEEAFEAIGRVSDYHMTYDMATWFVHAINVDHDFVRRDDAELHLKPLVEHDPKVIQTFLGDIVISFLQMLRIYVDERGFPSTDELKKQSRIVFPEGQAEDMDPLTALMALAFAEFPSGPTKP